jgi:hypothetical protein
VSVSGDGSSCFYLFGTGVAIDTIGMSPPFQHQQHWGPLFCRSPLDPSQYILVELASLVECMTWSRDNESEKAKQRRLKRELSAFRSSRKATFANKSLAQQQKEDELVLDENLELSSTSQVEQGEMDRGEEAEAQVDRRGCEGNEVLAAATAVSIPEATVALLPAVTAGSAPPIALQLQQQEEQSQTFSSASSGSICVSPLASPTSSCSSTPSTSSTSSPLTGISNRPVSSVTIDGSIGSKRVSANSMPLSPRRSQSPFAIDDDDADNDNVISKQYEVNDFNTTFSTQHSRSSTMSQ